MASIIDGITLIKIGIIDKRKGFRFLETTFDGIAWAIAPIKDGIALIKIAPGRV